MSVSAITKDQAVKILKVALYLAVSSVIGAVLARIADDPMVFGVATPIVNVVLVTLKQFFTEGQ